MSPVDAGRVIRARITAALVHDTRHRTQPAEAEACEAVGWPLRAACADDRGRVVCPLCRDRVTATHAAAGVVRIDPHLIERPGGPR